MTGKQAGIELCAVPFFRRAFQVYDTFDTPEDDPKIPAWKHLSYFNDRVRISCLAVDCFHPSRKTDVTSAAKHIWQIPVLWNPLRFQVGPEANVFKRAVNT